MAPGSWGLGGRRGDLDPDFEARGTCRVIPTTPPLWALSPLSTPGCPRLCILLGRIPAVDRNSPGRSWVLPASWEQSRSQEGKQPNFVALRDRALGLVPGFAAGRARASVDLAARPNFRTPSSPAAL